MSFVYEPDQLKPGFFSCCSCINWYTHDSPCCASCAKGCRNVCLPMYKSVNLYDEEWMQQMLHGTATEYAKEFDGIWWLRDHALHTTLFTMRDLTFEKKMNHPVWDEVASISMSKHWMRNETTCMGVILTSWYHVAPRLNLYISKDAKWIQLGNSPFQFMRRIDNSLKNAIQLQDVQVGDFLRVNIDEHGNIIYMYLIQKIAFRNQQGRIVTTKAFEEMKSRLSMSSSSTFTCQPSPPSKRINPMQMIRL